MKKIYRSGLIIMASVLLSGCGQPGPLYLPGTQPPIHVEPEPQVKQNSGSEPSALEQKPTTEPTNKPEPSN